MEFYITDDITNDFKGFPYFKTKKALNPNCVTCNHLYIKYEDNKRNL